MSFRAAVLLGLAKVRNVHVIHNSHASRAAVMLRGARFCSSQDKPTVAQTDSRSEPSKKGSSSHIIETRSHRVTEIDKTILVWTGRFKTKEEIPDLLSDDTLHRARSKVRIYGNIGMGVILVIAIIFMVKKGRRDLESGDSLAMRNMKRHPQHYPNIPEAQAEK